ncbi:MAG: PilZ domain-containing protein [Anaerolineales bacterium]|jgi:hypothetical protein|uniref:PilZ domain-containing protein n=1 Tax=Candidatus Villigracilis affinis TaxID=3140682 RepID=UPI001D613CC8|nr:PilZ domain-containing protein [Anaerolineales bacterium]MBK9600781.1 PilZ domain-containing protein [Anaerolineales bacterium]MBL0344526.1 PilZ domain-containing protein [Anaerolineales bacterium]
METEQRNLARRNFSYYMRVKEESSGKVIGHIADISTGGFRIDSTQSIPLNVDLRLYIDQIGEISNKTYILLKARPMWCRPDQFDPNMFNIGFKLIDITPVDREVYLKMYDTYGDKTPPKTGELKFPPE